MSQPKNRKPRLLIIEDDETTSRLISHFALKQGFDPLVRSSAASACPTEWGPIDVVLLDLELPDGDGFDLLCQARKHRPEIPCFVLTSHDRAQTAVASLKAGASDYFTKPFDPSIIFPAILQLMQQPSTTVIPIPDAPTTDWKSPAMIATHRAAVEAANSLMPVLITGEFGTGKRSIARLIHARSTRASGPFVAIDAGILDPATAELDLFGADDAATLAKTHKRGRVHAAHNGTLFISNIEQLPNPVQARLVQLVESPFRASSDFRLIAATTVPQPPSEPFGSFRPDLFYRFSIVLHIPALREVAEDIPTWCDRLLTEICVATRRRRPHLTRGALEALLDQPWPGNVHELRRTLEAALTRNPSTLIGMEDLSTSVLPLPPPTPADTSLLGHARLEDLERVSLIAALEACGGNRRRAAKRLGVSLRTIYNMIQRHGLRNTPPSVGKA